MLKNPEDRRARRSRRLLKESLLELMKERAFSEITVRDVADGADMNRGTFYLHYSGTAELLQSLERDLLEELQALVEAHMAETLDGGNIRPVMEPVVDFVVEHRDTCTTLFASSEATGFIQALQQLIRRNGTYLVDAWFHPQDPGQTDYLLSFLTWGAIGLLKEWFSQDMALPREELIASTQRMVDGAASSLFGRPAWGRGRPYVFSCPPGHPGRLFGPAGGTAPPRDHREGHRPALRGEPQLLLLPF